MLSCRLSGDSFSNQRKKPGTHLYSSSRVAGKQSARYFQFGLAQHFLLCGESGLVAFFDEREVRPQPEPVPRNKQWRELLTKRLEWWRPNASLTSPSVSLRALVFETNESVETWSNSKAAVTRLLQFSSLIPSVVISFCEVSYITTSLITRNSQKPDLRFA